MKLAQVALLFDSQSHRFWKSHAHVVSRQTPSILPCDLIYIILRCVPSLSYLHLYEPEPAPYDCAQQYDPWQQPDLDEPKHFGDY